MASNGEEKPTIKEDVKTDQSQNPQAPKKKYGFRLTPEEQEIAYELKAGMMRKLDEQNDKIQTELQINRKMKEIIKNNPRDAKPKKYEYMSQTNAIKLMKLYEKKAKEAADRINELEAELAEANGLARRYRDRFLATRQVSPRHSSEVSPPAPPLAPPVPPSDTVEEQKEVKVICNEEKVTEDELDDDEALYNRHIAKLAGTKAMITTSPIRLQDIIRKSEVVINQNDDLKREVVRLKEENARLMLSVKQSNQDRLHLNHAYMASEANRKDLMKRLGKEQKQYKTLNHSLTQQASDWIQARKDMQQREDLLKWTSVSHMSVLGAQDRTFSHPVKKNVFQPRKMHPVESYARASCK